MAAAAVSVPAAAAGSITPQPGTLKVLKGGYRSTTDDSATDYSNPLAGAWLEHDTSSSFPSPIDFPAMTDLLGVASAGVSGGTHYVREKSAPTGWHTLPKLAWGGSSPSEKNYVASATVNGGTSTATVDSGASTRFVNALDNPPLPTSCGHGLKVLLLLDRSGSTEPYKSQYAAAAKTFVKTLADTPTTLKITSFATTVDSGNGTTYQLSNPADRAAADGKIDTVYSNPSGSTNWDQALQDASGAGVDVVVFITDGNPTVRKGNTSGGGSTEIDDITYGIASANVAKNPDGKPASGDEQTMLGVGVGALSVANLAAVTGPTEGKDYTTASDPSELAALLKSIATKLCGGKLKVTKSLAPSSDPGLFDLKVDGTTRSPDGGVGNDGTTGWLEVAAGDHTVSEEVASSSPTKQDDYFSSIACVDKQGAPVGSDGKVTVKADAEISCTVTNTRKASVTVRKATDPSGSTQKFDFSGDPAGGTFQLADGDKNVVGGLEPGKYSFSEKVPSGWDLSGIKCSGTKADPIVDGSSVTLDLAAGENADCTWTNSGYAHVTVTKSLKPVGSGKFDLLIDGVAHATAVGDGGTTGSVKVKPGEHVVDEQAADGTDLGMFDTTTECLLDGKPIGVAGDFEVEAGDDVQCTITNVLQGSVTVHKATDPAGSTTMFDFKGDPAGGTFQLADGGKQKVDHLSPGKYSFSEKVPSGWDLSGIKCSGTKADPVVDGSTVTLDLAAGENADCTWTNTEQGHVVIAKSTDPSGSSQAFDFTGPTKGNTFQLTDGTDKSFDLAPGKYTVAESATSGWDLSKLECKDVTSDTTVDVPNATANIVLSPGETVKCVFTNSQQSSVTVRKATDPTGSSQLFDFSGDPAGGTFQLADGGKKLVDGLKAGKYSFSEKLPTGWDLTSLKCTGTKADPVVDGSTVTLDLAAGENADCTWTNTEQGHVVIAKATDPSGSSQAFDFTGPTKGNTFQLTDGTDKSFDLAPGKYTVAESATSGWDLSKLECKDISSDTTVDVPNATANIVLAAGETVKCVFTNSQQSSVTVRKATDPLGSATLFDFTGDPAGGIFQLADGGKKLVDGLKAGKYTFSESVPTGWDLTSLKCTGTKAEPVVDGAKVTLDLAAGENADCTWTNTQQGTILIKKTVPGGSEANFDFSGPSTGDPDFAITAGNTKTFSRAAGKYSVTELEKTGWNLTGLTCSDQQDTTGGSTVSLADRTASIDLQSGETVTCEFTNAEKPAVINVTKLTSDGSVATYGFTGSDPIGAFTLTSGGDADTKSFQVPAGKYTVAEDPIVGSTLDSIACDTPGGPVTFPTSGRTATLDLAAGETADCRFTNTPGGGVLPGRVGSARISGSSGCARRTFAYENVTGRFISTITWYVNHKRYRKQTSPNVRNRIWQLKFRTASLHRSYYAISAVVAFQQGVTPTSRKLRRSFRLCGPLVSTG